MHKFLPKLLLLSSCSVFSFAAMAGGPEIIQAGWWPYPAGATATALSGEIATGFADSMIPVYGKPTQFFYFDPQGQINNSHQYAVSAGVGGRYLWQNKGILGAYVFGDYNHSQYNNSFWFVSPGLEFLGDSFDVTGNLYIPVGTQKYNTGNEVFGQDIGIYDGVTFAGHTEYDELYQTTETNGFGGDIDVAYRIPLNKYNPKLHLAGYFSNPEDAEKNRAGGAVRLEFPFSEHLSILVTDSYDNVSYNTVRAGASYSFGGRHTSYNYKNDLETRMVDPIQRNIIANTSDIRNSQPISENTLDAGGSAVYLDNITFFVPDPGLLMLIADGNGTYEHPYVGMSQTEVDAANAAENRNFFVQSGTYGNPNIGMDSLVLENDFVMGRESYNGNPFVKQAQDTQRPEFFFAANGFSVTPNDFNTTLSSLYLFGPGLLPGTSGVTFIQQNNGQVDTLDNMNISNFYDGVFGQTTTAVTGQTTLNVLNSTIHFLGEDAINYTTSGIGGVFTMNVKNTSAVDIVRGIFLTNDGDQNIVLNVDESAFSPADVGLVVDNGDFPASTGQAVITVTDSIFIANGGGIIIGNNSQGLLTFTLTDSRIANANNGNALTLTNTGSAGIDAVVNNTAITDTTFAPLSVIQGPTATGDINLQFVNGVQFLNNVGNAVFITAGGSSGAINLLVDDTVGAAVLFNEDVDRTVLGGAITATFVSANGSSFSLSGGSSVVQVYCDSTGICTRL